jgi:hypothetical protein
MAIGGSGYYGLTLEKQFKGTQAGDMETTDVAVMLVLDAYTPAYDTHAFRDPDITTTPGSTPEVTDGAGYTGGGKALAATPSWTVASPGAGQIAYDSDSPAWATSTITDAMAAILYDSSGTDTTDELYMLSDFGTEVSTANGTLTVAVDSNGWVYYDYVA